ncbi:MlaD family protein [Pseudoalteromonas rubra]|uniref:Mce/MlaD domain-containing protein n=1 Tax=Pseudoalteromonas rubra TaxID=43658 RepID=A0A5S3X562_9GAMM|nr:MlaD family protein [Pseudoalteromonas rubra]TMP39090.1 hypothetical protein CWB98_03905 [Pseudoalteromonas rubra]
MQHKPKNANRIVIAFSLTGVLLLAMFCIMILVNNHTFADKVYYKTVLDNARGLSALPAIYFKGMEIGRIDDYQLNLQSNEIDVEFWVFQEYSAKVVKYALLTGEQHPIFDEVTTLDLILPEADKVGPFVALPAGALVPHINSALGKQYLTAGYVSRSKDDVESILSSIQELLQNLQKEDNPEAGSLFRALDRVAKISDHIMIVSEELRESELLPEAEKTLKQSQVWLAQMPQLLAQLNQTLVKTDGMLTQAQSTLTTYGQPTELVKEITDSQLPLVLHNLNANLTVMQQMLKDVHGEREQFALTVHSVQQVLEQMEKTLEALNNHPVFRDGISTPVKNGEIEMHD